MRVACILFSSITKELQHNFAEACFRFTPQIALGDNTVFLEIGACQKLYSEQSLHARLQMLLKRFSLSAKIAMDNDIPTALARATFNGKLPIEVIEFYYNPFRKTESLQKTIAMLKHLGVLTLEDLKALPAKSLASRFGKEAVMALHYIYNANNIVWPRFFISEKIRESADIDESYLIQELEPILFLLKKIIDKCLLRLRGRGQLASAVQVILEQESYSTVKQPLRTWQIEFSFPQGMVLSVLPIIRERLNISLQHEPLESAIKRVEFQITKSIYGSSRQKDFFSKKEEEQESFHSIVSRLVDKLGEDKAFLASPVASYLPEKSWKKTLEMPPEHQSPVPERPLRIYKKPQPLRRVDDYFIGVRKKWKIQQMHSPERISGEWWFKDKERDYFKVICNDGEELWVFSIVGTQEYFLHGVFD